MPIPTIKPLTDPVSVRNMLMVHLAFGQQIAFQGNTNWEQLGCVGYNPALRQLMGVVHIKQTTGYQGNLCSGGSTEYVRFFVDWGSGLTDVGLTSFAVHDIPDANPDPPHPIEYMVRLTVDDEAHRRFCITPVLPRVRAVLAWNTIPTLDPNYVAPFGNHVDAEIQLQEAPFFLPLIDFDKEQAFNKQLAFVKSLTIAGVSPAQTAPAQSDVTAQALKAANTPVALETLLPIYRKAGVPDERTMFPIMHPLANGNVHAASMAAHTNFEKVIALSPDTAKINAILFPPGGPKPDTGFEELVCVGLNVDSDTLGAVIKIKRPNGYGGGLCQTGSTEYVAFWADFDDNGAFETYLGTAAVQVHDIAAIPPGGLHYAVALPCNFSAHLEPCSHPNVVRLRAVLSWSAPPSTVDPNAPVHWGNRLDVAMQLRPGKATTGLITEFFYVGSVPTSNISTLTFLAQPSAGVLNSADCSQPARDRPFAGATTIGGSVFNAPPGTVYYSAQVKAHAAGAWSPVMTGAYSYIMSDPTLPPFFQKTVNVNSPDGWYLFQDNPAAGVMNIYNQLATWNTNAVADGTYDLRIAYTTDYPITGASVIHFTNVVTVVVSNKLLTSSNVAGLVIDPTFDVDIVIDGGDCHSYPQKQVINGHLRAVNPYFWYWSIQIQPSTHTHGTQANPQCRSYGSLGDGGAVNDAWQIDTTNLDKCGYAATLYAYDRAVVNSNTSAVHGNQKSVGFSVV